MSEVSIEMHVFKNRRKVTTTLKDIESTPVEPFNYNGNEVIGESTGRLEESIVNEGAVNHSVDPPEGTSFEGVGTADQPSKALLASYLRLARWTGLTPNFQSTKTFNIKTILFGAVAIVSIFNAFCIGKYYVLYGMHDIQKAKQIVLSYITLGYFINILLLRTVFVLLACFSASKIKKMIETANEWSSFFDKDAAHQNKMVIGISFGASVTTAMLSPIVRALIRGFDITQLLLWHSNELAESIFLWKPESGHQNVEWLYHEYGTIATTRNVIMGIINLLFTIICYLHESCVRDFCLISAITIHQMTKVFEKKFKGLDPRQHFEENDISTIWQMYKTAQSFSVQLDDAAGTLISLIHLDTVIFSAYFLFDHIIEDNGGVSLADIHVIMKLAWFYMTSIMASKINSSFRSWIKISFPSGRTAFVENGEHVNAVIILDDLATSPIGVGSSLCFIDKAFLWKFLSIVGSFFLFFADVREGEMF